MERRQRAGRRAAGGQLGGELLRRRRPLTSAGVASADALFGLQDAGAECFELLGRGGLRQLREQALLLVLDVFGDEQLQDFEGGDEWLAFQRADRVELLL